MSIPNLAKIGENLEQKKIKEYSDKVAHVTSKVLQLVLDEGVDTCGKALDVIKTAEQTVQRMMYDGKFEAPKK